MSADAVLDQAVANILQLAQQEESPRNVLPGGMDFGWSGGGQPIDITAVDPMLLEVPFDARLVWAHLYALDGAGEYVSVTAKVELRIRQATAGGGSVALYGTGSTPALSSAGFADLDITGWKTNYAIGDAIVARLSSLTGIANVVVLTLQLRPTEAPIGILGVTNASGDTIIDGAGNTVVLRS